MRTMNNRFIRLLVIVNKDKVILTVNNRFIRLLVIVNKEKVIPTIIGDKEGEVTNDYV